MAKKTTNKFSGGSIFDIVKSFDDSAEILGKSKTAVINDYIDSKTLADSVNKTIFKS